MSKDKAHNAFFKIIIALTKQELQNRTFLRKKVIIQYLRDLQNNTVH